MFRKLKIHKKRPASPRQFFEFSATSKQVYFEVNQTYRFDWTPLPGIEPGSPKGPVLKTGALPLCDRGSIIEKIV